jgi:hypothetical protein
MEHRAPSGKERRNERSNTRFARHTLGAGSRSSRHTTLVAEMLRGGRGRDAHPTPKPDSTRQELTVGSRSGYHQAANATKTLRGEDATTTHQNQPPCAESEQPMANPGATALLPPPRSPRRHNAPLEPPRCRLPQQPLRLCRWSTLTTARRGGSAWGDGGD